MTCQEDDGFRVSRGGQVALKVKAADAWHTHVENEAAGPVQDIGIEEFPRGGEAGRLKLVQEELIKASPVPYTILHSTQFFPFVDGIVKSGAVDGQIRLPTALAQPVHADDVVAVLADLAVKAPVNGTIEVAGPEAIPINRFAEEYLSAKDDPRPVIGDPGALYFGAVLDDRTLTPGSNARLGKIRLEDWLRELIPAD